MERVIDLFERNLLLRSTYPKWFDYGQTEEDRMWQLYDAGFVYPLIERDEEGRSVKSQNSIKKLHYSFYMIFSDESSWFRHKNWIQKSTHLLTF